MQIKLTNFKQHENTEITLPDTGLVLIKGRSGAGKSSILEAIEDALFETAQDVQPWNGGSPKVELIFSDSSKIIRTRNPGSLEFIDKNGNSHKGEEAQAKIIDYIGLNESEFESCCYIKQEGAGSLLTLTPSEQAKFIYRLSCGDVDPVALKDACAKLSQASNSEFAKLSEINKGLLEKAAQLTEISHKFAPKENVKKVTKSEVDNKQLELDEANSKYSLISSSLSEMNQKLGSQEYKNYLASKTQLPEIIKNKEELDKKISDLVQAQKNLIDTKEKRLQEIKDSLSNLEAEKNASRAKSKAQDLAKTIKDRFGIESNMIQSLRDRISAITEEDKKNNETLFEIKHRLKHANSGSLSCPHCSNKVFLKNNALEKSANPLSEDEISALSSELSRLERLISSNNADIAVMRASVSSAEELKKEIASFAGKPRLISEIENHMTQLADEKSKINSDFAIAAAEVKRLNDQRDQEDRKIIALTRAASLFSDDFQSQIDKLSEQKEALLVLKDQKTNELNQLKQDFASYTNYVQELDKHNLILKQIEEAKEQTKTINKDMNLYHNRVLLLDKLKSVIETSAFAAIENTIDTINKNAKDFVDRMFDSEGTSVLVRNFATTSKGEEKAKISIDITHKTQKVKRLNSLSGGEKARLRLAFQLALSFLYNSPILMIDEGLMGLGEDDKHRCLEIIKEVSVSKLVIVVEHGAPEQYFDEVISL